MRCTRGLLDMKMYNGIRDEESSNTGKRPTAISKPNFCNFCPSTQPIKNIRKTERIEKPLDILCFSLGPTFANFLICESGVKKSNQHCRGLISSI
jgi:hypothetical protein